MNSLSYDPSKPFIRTMVFLNILWRLPRNRFKVLKPRIKPIARILKDNLCLAHFLASCGFGFVSGILTASVGMGGPPIVIFLANQGWPKEAFRATVAFLFLITGTLSLFSHVFTGVTTGDRMLIGVSLIPAGIIGFYLGDALFAKISRKLFINLALILILISGLTSLATTLTKI
jgi:uncharacterized membrane protein YfcA